MCRRGKAPPHLAELVGNHAAPLVKGHAGDAHRLEADGLEHKVGRDGLKLACGGSRRVQGRSSASWCSQVLLKDLMPSIGNSTNASLRSCASVPSYGISPEGLVAVQDVQPMRRAARARSWHGCLCSPVPRADWSPPVELGSSRVFSIRICPARPSTSTTSTGLRRKWMKSDLALQ